MQVMYPLPTNTCPDGKKCAQTRLKKIRMFQNKTLKLIVNAPWFVKLSIRKDVKIPKFQNYIKHLVKSCIYLCVCI